MDVAGYIEGLIAKQTANAKSTEVTKIIFLSSSLWEYIHTQIYIVCECNGDRS
jgi:hypothetical protein